jgi:predicted cupin superfamily sugar epimerase
VKRVSSLGSGSTGADDIIRVLQLSPHPEGGFFRETFRAESLPFALPERGPRAASTAIYFLLRRDDFSAFHRVRSDEVWHHYLGAPLELHRLESSGHSLVTLGSALERGERPQAVVPAGVLQAARVAPDSNGEFTLVGCTVAPGFDFADFEMPSREELISRFPAHHDLVEALTRV